MFGMFAEISLILVGHTNEGGKKKKKNAELLIILLAKS